MRVQVPYIDNVWLKERLETDYSDATPREKLLIETLIQMGAVIITYRRLRQESAAAAFVDGFMQGVVFAMSLAAYVLAFVVSLVAIQDGHAFLAFAFFMASTASIAGLFYKMKRARAAGELAIALFNLHEGHAPFSDKGLIGRRRG